MGVIDILGSPDDMFDAIFRTFADLGIDTRSFTELDHICYRTASEAQYLNYSMMLHRFAKPVDVSEVNGRPIALFKLDTPFTFEEFTVDLLELPAPGKTAYNSGWEHVEFVAPNLREFMAENLSLRCDTSKLEDSENPTITFAAGDYRVKVHEKNILDVIKAREM